MTLHYPIKLEPDNGGTLLVTCPIDVSIEQAA